MRRLYRSRDERMVAGVAGGLAEYFNIDPTLVRLAFVAFTLGGGGVGLLAYLILAIITPLEPVQGARRAQPQPEARREAAPSYHATPGEQTKHEIQEKRIPEYQPRR